MPYDSELTLYDYKRLMWRHKNVFLSVAAGVLAGVVLFNELTPGVFEAAVVVNVDAPPEIRGSRDRPAYLEAELKTLQGASVLREAAGETGRLPRGAGEKEAHFAADELRQMIKAEPSGKAPNYITLTARARSSREAVALADAIVRAYAKDRRERAAERRKSLAAETAAAESGLRRSEETVRLYTEKNWLVGSRPYLVNRLMTLQSETEDLRKRYTVRHPEVEKTLKKISRTEELLARQPQQELEFQRLTGEMRLRQAAYDELGKKYGEAARAEAAENAAVFMEQPVRASEDPVLPRRLFNLAVAAFLGLFLGAAAVLVAEGMDASFSTVEEIERRLELPVLAMVTHIESPAPARNIYDFWKNLRAPKDPLNNMLGKLAFRHSPRSGFIEPYFTLRANLRLLARPGGRPGAAVCFTSAAKAEGKTLTSINFAFIAAQSGLRTLFIDGDLRFPLAHKLFSAPFGSGLADCLSGECRTENAVVGLSHLLKSDRLHPLYKRVPRGIENLYFLPAGTSPSNPADILTPERIETFLRMERGRYDLIVLDTPPLIPCADALLIGPRTDGVVMVLKAGCASGLMARRARDQLAGSGARILGAVLNDVYSAMLEPRYSQSYSYPDAGRALPASCPAAGGGAAPAEAARQVRVLIVDDDVPMRGLLNRFIRETYPAAEVYEAGDGAEAVRKMAELSPALVVLDIVLPSVNGLEVCSIARRGGNFRGAKILAVTGLNTEETRRKALEAGADDFLAKPFNLKMTQDKLRKLLIN